MNFGFATRLLVGSALVLSTSCATIIKSGGQEKVRLHSNPEGAMVTIKNLETGQVVQQVMTPAKVNLKRSSGYFEKARYEITFKKPGYKTHVRTIKGDLSAWYLAGNLLLGGVIGWLIVDPLTGAMYYLDEEVTVSLETATAEASSEQQLRVGTIKDLTPAQRSRLKPVPANGEKPRSASRAAARTQRR